MGTVIIDAMDSARTINWGFLGAGGVAAQFADALRLVPGARLSAVVSRTPERGRAFAKAFGADWAASLEELLGRDEIDIVYIATPAAQHHAQALQAIDARKAVLCEKPFTTSAAEAQHIADAARRAGVFCMEAMWMHFIPAVGRAVQMAREQIGDARMLSADFGVPTMREAGSNLFDPDGGGALLDRGVYPVHLAHRLFGEPVDVEALSSIVHGADEQTATLLRFDGGRLALLACTLTCYGTNGATIFGTEGRLEIGEPLCRPDVLHFSRIEPMRMTPGLTARPAAFGERLRHHPLARRVNALLRPRRRTIWVPYRGNGYVHEAQEVMSCLRRGAHQSDVVSLDLTLAVMRTIDRVRALSALDAGRGDK